MKVTAKGELSGSPESFDSRGDIKLEQCVPCKQRGHYCKAETEVDGEPWCNACLDGDPCMHELIERRRKTAAAAPIMSGERLHVRHRHGEVIRRVEESAGKTAGDVGAAGPEAGSPKEIAPATKRKQETKERNTMEQEKICGREGCGKKLTAANRSDFCTKHFYDSRRKTAGTAPARRGPKAATGKTAAPGCGVATICVTEDHLDNFWKKLSLEEKAELFTRQLQGA